MSTTSNKELDDFLDVESAVEIIEPVKNEIKPASNTNGDDTEEIDAEYKYAQDNLHNIIEKGTEALEEMLSIAKMTEQPRAFEVTASLIKTLSDANKDLLELKSKQKTLKGEKAAQKQNVTNALFVGSTAELQKLIKGKK